jgi:GT2 family glycosyltransferase
MNRNLAIVVLTWNDYKNTIQCLKTLLNQSYKDGKIILVDNNSNDGSFYKIIQWLNKNYRNKIYNEFVKVNSLLSNNIFKKKVFIIKNRINYGCGMGHNPGYKLAIKNNFKLVARIDNDMNVPRNFLKNILKNFNNPNIKAISPKILYDHNKKLIWWKGCTIQHNLKFDKHLRNYPYNLLDSKNFKGLINTDSIAGCASIMRCDRLKKIGLSDKDFFYGPEDIEFSRRIYDSKDSLKVDLNVKIYHGVRQSFLKRKSQRIYYESKYRLVLISKIGTFWDKTLGYSTAIIKFLLYCMLFLKKKHKNKIVPVGFAIIHFFLKKWGDFDRKMDFKLK